MKHDIFDFDPVALTWPQRAWRIAFLVVCIGVLFADLYFWRPN